MISRLKRTIAQGHDTKLPGEDGEDAATGWGTRLSPKAKPFIEDPKDTPRCGWKNKPNLEKNPAGIKVQVRRNN